MFNSISLFVGSAMVHCHAKKDARRHMTQRWTHLVMRILHFSTFANGLAGHQHMRARWLRIVVLWPLNPLFCSRSSSTLHASLERSARLFPVSGMKFRLSLNTCYIYIYIYMCIERERERRESERSSRYKWGTPKKLSSSPFNGEYRPPSVAPSWASAWTS